MSDKLFYELHQSYGEASANPSGVRALTNALDEMRECEAQTSGGGGIAVLTTPRKLSSFSVYWDAEAKQLKLYEPLVFVGTTAVECESPSLESNQTYWCVVKKTESEGESKYTAEINTSGTADDAVLAVKICQTKGEDEDSVQYHVGAVVLTPPSSNLVPGDDTNIVFTPKNDGSGEIKVDVYYK